MAKVIKMRTLVSEALWDEKDQKPLSIEEKKRCMEAIKSYGQFGKQLNSESNLIEVAKKLSELAENATNVALSETEDWFDKNTVNRNMNELKSHAKNFQKVATEAQRLQERMAAMYEDMGHILNRYYDIDGIEDGIEQAKDSVNRGSDGPVDPKTKVPPEIDPLTKQPPIKEAGENSGKKEFFGQDSNIFDSTDKERAAKEKKLSQLKKEVDALEKALSDWDKSKKKAAAQRMK